MIVHIDLELTADEYERLRLRPVTKDWIRERARELLAVPGYECVRIKLNLPVED